MTIHRLILSCIALCMTATTGFAQLPQADQAILVVSGQIAETNAGQEAHFDPEMLRDLDWVEVETYTSFTEGPQVFSGPTLKSLMDAVGANGGALTATALNGYYVEIPMAHAAEHDVILAMEHNGKRMRVRDKGPIWIVYPLSEARAQDKPFDTEMIWQLQRLDVKP